MAIPEITGSISSNSINVSWDSSGATRYQLDVTNSSIGSWVRIIDDKPDKRTIYGVSDGDTWEFRVRARGDGTTWSVEWSDWSSTYKATNSPPPAPSGFSFESKTTSSLTIGFNLPSDVNRYQVRRKTSGGWVMEQVQTGSPGTKNTYTLSNLSSGYTYQVALRFFGDGKRYKDVGSAWTASQSDSTELSPPTNFRVTVERQTTIGLAWDSRRGIGKYGLAFKVAAVDTWIPYTNGYSGNASSITIRNLPCGASIQFLIYAYGDGTTRVADWSAGALTRGETDDCEAYDSGYRTSVLAPASASIAHSYRQEIIQSGSLRDFTYHQNIVTVSNIVGLNLLAMVKWDLVRAEVEVFHNTTRIVHIPGAQWPSMPDDGNPNTKLIGGRKQDTSSSKYGTRYNAISDWSWSFWVGTIRQSPNQGGYFASDKDRLIIW